MNTLASKRRFFFIVIVLNFLLLVIVIVCSVPVAGSRDNKKAWTDYFVYAYRGIAKHRCTHIQVKAHAIGVSVQLLLLNAYFYFGEFSISKNKANASLS